MFEAIPGAVAAGGLALGVREQDREVVGARSGAESAVLLGGVAADAEQPGPQLLERRCLLPERSELRHARFAVAAQVEDEHQVLAAVRLQRVGFPGGVRQSKRRCGDRLPEQRAESFRRKW